MSLEKLWREKWRLLGLALLLYVVGSAIIHALTKRNGTSDSGPVAGTIVPSMTSSDNTFWQRLSVAQKGELGADCRAQLISDAIHSSAGDNADANGDTRRQIAAFTATQLAQGVTHLYADYSNTIYNIKDACAEVITEIDAQKQQQQNARQSAQIESDVKRQQHVLDSVKNHTFVATDASVRAYMKADTIGYAIRSVRCTSRAVCSIAYDDVAPENHPILSTLLGSGVNDPEFQLIQPMTRLFKALFSDSSLQRASLTSWIQLQTVGGKVVLWPALSISCDRAANAQVDWNNVTPDGLKQLCSYALLPQGSP